MRVNLLRQVLFCNFYFPNCLGPLHYKLQSYTKHTFSPIFIPDYFPKRYYIHGTNRFKGRAWLPLLPPTPPSRPPQLASRNGPHSTRLRALPGPRTSFPSFINRKPPEKVQE